MTRSSSSSSSIKSKPKHTKKNSTPPKHKKSLTKKASTKKLQQIITITSAELPINTQVKVLKFLKDTKKLRIIINQRILLLDLELLKKQ